MTIKDEVVFRPVDFENDLEFAYACLFRPGIEKFVAELNGGVWPDSRYDFFKKGFADPDMKMITHNGVDVGCFCISDTPEAIVLQRVYLLDSYQRKGIGQRLVGMALEKAHADKKPLELEVLENNLPAIDSYKKAGFEQCSLVIVNGWNRKFSMRHTDTVQYLPPAAMPAPGALPPVTPPAPRPASP